MIEGIKNLECGSVMAFSLFYKKKTKELFVIYKYAERDAVCVISIDKHPAAKEKGIGVDEWKPVLPEFSSFSFDKAYSLFRGRKASDSFDEYSYHKSILDRFFHDSLDQAEMSLLDRYNFSLFLILLYIRRASLQKLIEKNAALVLLLIHDSCNSSLPFESDELWANIRETAQLTPSEIIKKIYNLKASRKAASILQKIDTKELSDIEPLLKLKDTLRDCWIMGLLDHLPKISYDILLIVIDRRNRSLINAGFLTSVSEATESQVSALFMLQWMHAQNITIHFPFSDVPHLHSVYTQLMNQKVISVAEEPVMNAVPSYCTQTASELFDDYETTKDDPLSVPYRMENTSDIKLALEHDVLGLGTEIYQKLLKLSDDIAVIERPSVLLNARPVSRVFYILKEKKITRYLESYKQSKALERISNSGLIDEQFPDIDKMTDPDYLDVYAVSSNGDNFRKRLRGHAYALKRDRLLHEHLRGELRSVIKTNQPRSMASEELKRLITATTLHSNRNRDVVQALNIAQARQDKALRENALAELLFTRIPAYIRTHFENDPKMITSIRQKLLTRLSKIPGPANLKIALFHLAPKSNLRNREDFINAISRLLSFIERTEVIDDDSKTSVRSFIQNMIGEIRRLESVYHSMFLAQKELLTLFSLYKPNDRLVRCDTQHIERIIQEHCLAQALYMYPCKDYLDLEKYRWSCDCSQGSLAVNHFSAPQFFNIRLFMDNEDYCGNIYMLQLEHNSRQYLLIDRIQTSEFSAQYVLFYQILRDALLEMFKDFPFHEILLSNSAASNNRSLNQIFQNSKKDFPKVHITFNLPREMRMHFESLRDDTFRVLCGKDG